MCLHAPMKALFEMKAKRLAIGTSWALEFAKLTKSSTAAVTPSHLASLVLLQTFFVCFLSQRYTHNNDHTRTRSRPWEP